MAAIITADFDIYYLSENAVTVTFGNAISEGNLAQIHNLNTLIRQQPFVGLISTVPAYTTLSVFFNPVLVISADSMPGIDCFEKVSNFINGLAQNISNQANIKADVITIPVCYGGIYGPDVDEVAVLNNMTAEDVINIHSGADYKVGMIGFVPGFAYMTGLDEKLETPRRQSPRKAVPRGSVGIAGRQTGIYSLETPGGWQIIGRTPLKLFDAARKQPSFLKSGDRIVFKPISTKEFNELAAINYADKHH